jgi:hypothetical protein
MYTETQQSGNPWKNRMHAWLEDTLALDAETTT